MDTELGADYWVIKADGAAIGGSIERRRTELGQGDHWFGIYRDPTGTSIGL